MRKFLGLLLVLLMLASPALAIEGISVEGAYTDGVYTAEGEGYLGALKVEVTVTDGKIADVKLLETMDTDGIYNTAEESVIPAIIETNSVNGIDAATGATYTSKGILEAVASALGQAGATVTIPEPPQAQAKEPMTAAGTIYHGFGAMPNFRLGPGRDSTETQVYSFNVTMASALFDSDGRILDLQVDIYEVSTPNYDGASMPHFSGWPGKEGYNVTDHETGAVAGVSDNTEEWIQSEVNGWLTKRERGDSYGMNAQNEWYKQMDAMEAMFVGKTVEEAREWFAKYTSARNGRPIKPTSENEDDIKALADMTDEEKAMLADVVTSVTMSLSDSHGLILEAIEKAYENRLPAIVVD